MNWKGSWNGSYVEANLTYRWQHYCHWHPVIVWPLPNKGGLEVVTSLTVYIWTATALEPLPCTHAEAHIHYVWTPSTPHTTQRCSIVAHTQSKGWQLHIQYRTHFYVCCVTLNWDEPASKLHRSHWVNRSLWPWRPSSAVRLSDTWRRLRGPNIPFTQWLLRNLLASSSSKYCIVHVLYVLYAPWRRLQPL